MSQTSERFMPSSLIRSKVARSTLSWASEGAERDSKMRESRIGRAFLLDMAGTPDSG
jgi:hypothetical protein